MQWCRDVASGADRHLDITFGLQLVKSSSIVSVRFREAFNYPFISIFHLQVNGFFFLHVSALFSGTPYLLLIGGRYRREGFHFSPHSKAKANYKSTNLRKIGN